MEAILLRYVLPILAPVVVGGIKHYAASQWAKIPPWARPLVSSIIGALAGIAGTGVASVAVEVPLTPDSLGISAAIGGSLGSVGRDARDSWAAWKVGQPSGVD